MKRIKTLLVAISVFSGVFLSSAAICSNYSFLRDSPVRYFTAKDWQLYKATANKALEHGKNGSKMSWKNPTSGNWGYFQPVNTTMKNGLKCRKLHIFDYANHREAKSTFEVCKYKEGWKVPAY